MSNKGQTVYDQVHDHLVSRQTNQYEQAILVSRLVGILAQKGLLTPSDVSALLGETIEEDSDK